MHFRKKHATGKPTYRKLSSEWRYPPLEKGSSKKSRYSVSKAMARANQKIKEYYTGLSSNG